jgi:hypothetical protein
VEGVAKVKPMRLSARVKLIFIVRAFEIGFEVDRVTDHIG